MSTLVVYYSRTGHNEAVAKRLQEQAAGDIDQIIDSQKRDGMFGCVLAAMFKSKTKIRYQKHPEAYDQVIVVTPLWGGVLPPATRTYLAQNRERINRFAFVSVCGRGAENRNVMADVRSTAHKEPFTTLLIKETEVSNPQSEEKLQAFANALPH
jgi:flavodoxin